MADSPPTISLVTPSLDQARYIRATIDSVLGQGYAGLDYFIQDGGSTDGTLEILAEYAGRVPYVSEPDRGQADAINRGLARASGEVLGYLNSDDLLLPGALAAVGDTFASDPDLVFVYGRAIYIDAEGRRLGPYLTRPYDAGALASFCFVAQPAAFFRRRVWEEIGPFDASLHHTMDYDFWLRLASRYPPERVRYIDRELAAARLHPDAKTVAGWGRALEEILDLVKRRTGYVSLWWCVAKWDHEIDGRNQVIAPHPVPWRAYPPALWEFLRRNGLRPGLWWRGLKGAIPGLKKRLSAGVSG
ncbi:MAG TPA: glycosyltransferase family 2 protein [Thermoanaerobaculia bacterium]|nr:glycosyltransferase family 2 protein [Thermoanaerobaculia bacterium]